MFYRNYNYTIIISIKCININRIININFINNDLLNNINKKYDIIVSNPPYWNSEKILAIMDVVSSNPLAGFDGGEDGLHFIKRIIEI